MIMVFSSLYCVYTPGSQRLWENSRRNAETPLENQKGKDRAVLETKWRSRESTCRGDKKSRRIILEIPQEVVSQLLGVIASDLSQGYKPSLVSLFLIHGIQAFSQVAFMHICSLATYLILLLLLLLFSFKVVAVGQNKCITRLLLHFSLQYRPLP